MELVRSVLGIMLNLLWTIFIFILYLQDFDSEFIKNKGHYNSFVNKEFFITVDRVERDLRKYGSVRIPQDVKEVLKNNLKCHICKEPITRKPGMKVLQEHLKKHLIYDHLSKID